MTWYISALLSVAALAAAELLQQKLLNNKVTVSPRTSATITFFLQGLLAAIVLVVFYPSQMAGISLLPSILPYQLAVGVISMFTMNWYLTSFKVKNISISTLFISCSVIVSTTMGIIIFAESTSLAKFAGLALILIGIVIINLKKGLIEKNHLYGLLAGIGFGVSYTLDKFSILKVEPLLYLASILLIITVFGIAANPKKFFAELKQIDRTTLGLIGLSGACYFLFNFATFSAYRLGGEVGRVDAINNSQVFLILLVELFVFKQFKGWKAKLLAVVLAVAGVWVLGNF